MPDTFAIRFRGYVAARKRHRLQPDELGPESSEWSIDPVSQTIIRRGGSKIIEDTIGAVVGLFDTDFDGRAEFAGGIHSPSHTTDYGTPAYLYTNETTKKGCLGWIDRNQAGAVASHKQIGKDFGSTHYSTAASTVVRMKIPPLWFENSTTPLGRHTTTAQRELSAAGSRQWLEVGDRLYLPNAQGTPLWINKRHNAGTGTGTEDIVVFPWGNAMPLHLPNAQLAAATGASDNNWKDGDAFFLSVQYEYEDGSLSIPFVPRAQGTVAATATVADADLTTGGVTDCRNGQILVGTVGGTAFYKSITYTKIPVGPRGVKYVRLLRSDKVNLASASAPFTVSPTELHQIVKLPNGTSTYIDTGGDNGTLAPDQRIIDSFLQMWAPQAQYVIGADSRVVVGGNVRLGPCAIVIAPIGINAFGDVNAADTAAALYGTVQCFITVSATTLTLKVASSGFPTSTVGSTSITLTNKTLQEVVDQINEATAIAAGPPQTVRWGAQLVPGIDGATAATNLADTTAANYFGDDAMLNGGATSTGNMRAFGPTYFGILHFSQSYMSTLTKDPQAIVMTSASPTVPGGNANSFFIDKSTNWKSPPNATCGRLMGLAPITGRGGVVCVAFYEKGWYVLRNTVGGGSGQDADYRLVSLDEHDGCVSHRTIVAGPGWAGCMTPLGFSVTDGDTKVLISRDIWDAKLSDGLFAQEMVKAIAAASKGGQDHYFAAKVLDSKLCITYRSDDVFTYANRRVEYEFGEGSDSLGIAGILRQSDNGRPVPYGWSCPVENQRVSVMGRYEDDTGVHHFGCNESATGSTGDGRIDEFDVGSTDNAGGYGSAAGSAFTSNAHSATFPAPAKTFFNLRSLSMRYMKVGSGLSVEIKGDGPTNQGARSDSATLTCPSSGSNLYGELQSNIPNGLRGDYSAVEFVISDDGSGENPSVESLDVDFDSPERCVVT